MKFKDLTNNSSKNLLKLKAGEEIRGVFRGDPVDYRQHWHQNRGVICPGRHKCELCNAGEKSAFRFRINFIVNENGAYVAKVFEQGRAVYEALKALHTDYNLEKHQMKIKRLGSGTETTYNILPVPNGNVTDELEKKLSAIPVNPLSEATEEGEDEEESF